VSNTPRYVIVHTAASGSNGTDFDVSAAEIDRWHKERGWNGIGYHYVVRKTGAVELGRPETARGAHCMDMNMNSQSIGICFSGHSNYTDWTTEQHRAGIALIADICTRWSIPVENVMGHRETGARKDCPGTRIDMRAVRNAVEAALLRPAPDRNPAEDIQPPFTDHPLPARRVLWETDRFTIYIEPKP
jgi:N-acetylmuramoyl-L-alanine amidase